MEQNYSSTKLPTVGASSAIGGAAAWSNPSRITADDASSASWGAFMGGQHSAITGSTFAFQQLPDSAVIDGISVYIDGSQVGAYGSVNLNISGSVGKDLGALNGGYGGPNDLWGKTSISKAEIAALAVTVNASDVSGGDAIASIDFLSIGVFWHIDVANIPDPDVPTRIDHKVYSATGRYLGLMPNVTSKFAFAQDMNSAGSSMEITCGKYANNEVTVAPLQTEAGDIITTEDDRPITVTETDIVVARGNAPEDAIFKNGNRVKIWMYNEYYPNGKLMFSGQMNRVKFRYGAANKAVKLTVYSDGLDLDQYYARGFPFALTTDQSQTSVDGYSPISFGGGKFPGWDTQGQTWRTGAAVNNVAAIVLMLQGAANVRLVVYDAPNGNALGSVTVAVNEGAPTPIQFEFPSLIPVSPSTEYFFGIWLDPGQSINVWANTGGYANGSRYFSVYSGGSGGGSFTADLLGDMYFVTKSGLPTTTATYTGKDPVSDMGSDILYDYNLRGGKITERDFEASGLSLTYVFVMATIFDAFKKVLEMIQSGYYIYIDLGTAEMDIKQMSETADFTIVRGRDFSTLDIDLSIEQVKNYLLLSGGDTGGGVNLYRDYQDTESSGNYGLRTATKSDNRITLTPTADAIGESFIDENSEETQETQLVVLASMMDITLLLPGKTIGFKNFDSLVNDMILPIVRREPNFTDGYVTLTLGRLPVRLSDEVQRIQRELFLEQTINNPTAPS